MKKWELLMVKNLFKLNSLIAKYETSKWASLIVSSLLAPTLAISLIIVLGTAIGAGVNTNNYNEYNSFHGMYSLTEQYSTKPTLNWETTLKIQNKASKVSSSYVKNDQIKSNATALEAFEKLNKIKGAQEQAATDANWSDVNAYHSYLKDQSDLRYVYAGTSEFIGSTTSAVIFSVIALLSGGLIYKIKKTKKTKKSKLTSIVDYEETTDGIFTEPS